MNQTPLSPKAVTHRYLWELGFAMVAYVGVILLSAHWLRGMPASGFKLLIALLPLLPLAFVFLAVIRFVRHTDEMLRRLHVQAFAIAAGVTAFLALTYGCLEMAGFPHLSAWWTFVCIDLVWGLAVCVLQRRYR
ncbi:MAG: hypothetical protein ACRETO_10520 [Gammaproteobacteria bacterium]